MGMGGHSDALVALPPGKRLDLRCTGGWVGPRAGLDGAENLARTCVRFPDPPVRSEIKIIIIFINI